MESSRTKCTIILRMQLLSSQGIPLYSSMLTINYGPPHSPPHLCTLPYCVAGLKVCFSDVRRKRETSRVANCQATSIFSQRLPPSLAGVLRPGQRACSLDGDADRLIYYYLDERNQFHLLDGDKIAALVAAFIVDLVKLAGLEEEIEVGVVQTAYANGSSTKYLTEVSPHSFFKSLLPSSFDKLYLASPR